MSTAMPTEEPARKVATSAAEDPLGEVDTRRFLVEFVRKRVAPADVEDVVQTVLLEALADEGRPTDPAELRRWLTGIARHKAADVHRRAGREPLAEPVDLEAGPPPVEARALVTWAEEQAASVRDAGETLRWMAREGEGEKLETIAAEEHVPAARVRQRVSRMRRWMKDRWLAELALVAAIAIAALVAYRLLRAPHDLPEALVPEPPSAMPPGPAPDPTPLDRARALRAESLDRCDRAEWSGCLDGLDRAARVDPAGDRDPPVAAARERARAALAPDAPAQKSSASPPIPAPSAAPTAVPLNGPSDAPNAPPKKAPPKAAPEARPPNAPPKSAKPSSKNDSNAPFDGFGPGGGSIGGDANAPPMTKGGPVRKK